MHCDEIVLVDDQGTLEPGTQEICIGDAQPAVGAPVPIVSRGWYACVRESSGDVVGPPLALCAVRPVRPVRPLHSR